MTDFQGLVRQWNAMIGDRLPETPTPPNEAACVLYSRLKMEEAMEFVDAAGCEVLVDGVPVNARSIRINLRRTPDLVAMVHENTDCLYIDFNIMNQLGVRADVPFLAIHAANMQKCPGGVCSFQNGKVIKPAGWKPADMRVVLALAGMRP